MIFERRAQIFIYTPQAPLFYMSPGISLQDVYEHPLVAEIINENKELRILSEKPDVTDLKDVPLPYTIKRHLLINEGVHNGTTYSAQMLRMAVDQHEGLQIFEDHKDTKGAAVQTWVGAVHNPVWSEADKAILGDVDIVDPKYAMAIAYGAKFGLSATVDVDLNVSKGKEIASDPIFRSYGLVIDPAVRETMLNENESESDEGAVEMTEELDLKSDVKSVIAKVDDAISRASAMKDTSLLTKLKEIKAMLGKLSGGTSYPYPKPGAKVEDEALEARFAAIESRMQIPSEPVSSEELAAALKENEKMKEELGEIARKELATRTEEIMKKELSLGLVSAAHTEKRKTELLAMNAQVLDAVEQNLDKTLAILNANPEGSKPMEGSKPVVDPQGTAAHKELAAEEQSRNADEKLLQFMMAAQGQNSSKVGGF